jgi:hypothetical protein
VYAPLHVLLRTLDLVILIFARFVDFLFVKDFVDEILSSLGLSFVLGFAIK